MNWEKISLAWNDIRASAESWIGHLIEKAPVQSLSGYDHIVLQLREMFIMAVCGACIAFLFEVYESILPPGATISPHAVLSPGADRVKRRRERVKIAVFDFLFCIMSAMIAARFWYVSSYGRISFHEAVFPILYPAGILLGRAVFAFKNSKHLRAMAVVYVIMLITAYIIVV